MDDIDAELPSSPRFHFRILEICRGNLPLEVMMSRPVHQFGRNPEMGILEPGYGIKIAYFAHEHVKLYVNKSVLENL